MNNRKTLFLAVVCAGALALLWAATGGAAAQEMPGKPEILGVRVVERDIVVTVRVPAGVTKVTLESRAQFGRGAWVPRAVQRLDGLAQELTFRLPRAGAAEVFRVRADAAESLPATFYKGADEFAGLPGSAYDGRAVPGGGVDTTAPGEDSKDSAARQEEEPDIWKIRGDRLFFFNQYRGLQVVDVAQPDAPVLLGTLDLPAAGEQMYLLGTDHVVLVARDGCGAYQENGSQVLVVEVGSGVPRIVAQVPVTGYADESRMVGTAIYVAAQTSRPIPGRQDGAWEWGTAVTSIDLATPASPVVRDTLWFNGYNNVLKASDRFLFVGTLDPVNWWQTTVQVVDIASPAGAMKTLSAIRLQGRLDADGNPKLAKFKMNLAGDTFATVSEDWRWNGVSQLVTRLETFSLAEPTAPRKLGELELGHGERLHAVRFDGVRVYVVTFFQIDPLWVVDLSLPQAPRIVGQLDIPGWSSFINPMGDRLIAVGIETNRVTVSLFDVKDPARPLLSSRVRLGGDNYSWSEANSDEKAFTMVTEAGLLLIPYSAWETNQWVNAVQLIDLGDDTLTKRGSIRQPLPSRRTALHRDRIFSISARELLSVDATDRNNPVVTSRLALAWPVDRVFLRGDYLVEITTGSTWDSSIRPAIRVVRTDATGTVLAALEVGPMLIAGAEVSGDRLYVALGRLDQELLPPAGEKDSTEPPAPAVANLALQIFDLSQLPALKAVGTVETVTDSLGWNLAYQALWPKPGVLVWSGGAGGYGGPWYWWGGGAIDAMPGRGMPWYWGGDTGRLLAFDVADAGKPAFVSNLNLATNGWWGFGSAFAHQGLVLLSHQVSEFVPDKPTSGTSNADGSEPKAPEPVPPPGTWVQRYFLDAVDYSDPTTPTPRELTVLPGQLRGVSHDGSVLYTVGPNVDGTTGQIDWTEWLKACSYDGLKAHLIAAMPLSANWPHPVFVWGNHLLLGSPAVDAITLNRLETWALSDTGKFVQEGSVPLKTAAQTLVRRGNLLVVQAYGRLDLLDASDPTAPKGIGGGETVGCFSYRVDQADGTLDRGVWVPLGDYGVHWVPITP